MSVYQLERKAFLSWVMNVAWCTLCCVEVVATTMSDVYFCEKLVLIRKIHLEVLCYRNAINNFRAAVPLSLVQKLKEARGAVVNSVICVH
jgi:hypothetical protein